MVAFHFPPLAGSSGIQRTLRFVQQLPEFGWDPMVLTAKPHAYERTSPDLLAEVPPNVVVSRATALDTARHLAIGGRHFAAWTRPDRWTTWRWDAVHRGMAMIRQYQPDVIWSTYPIATAHVIGRELAARSGLPWVADFRDPMAQDGYPADPKTWAAFERIERAAVEQARLCCFTTPSAARTYQSRYATHAHKIVTLENGYDEATFAQAEARLGERTALNPGKLTLLHSGIVYPSERDPTQLFEALARLQARQPALADKLRIRFRAAVAEDLLRQLGQQHGVSSMIEILPPVAYAEALREMLLADGLLVMQASNCNEQIPAKIYEYLRARRPILSLTDVQGDTWGVMRQAGLDQVAALDSATDIETLLAEFTSGSRPHRQPDDAAIAAASRHARSAELARHLNAIAG